jgi:hypothetical protein
MEAWSERPQRERSEGASDSYAFISSIRARSRRRSIPRTPSAAARCSCSPGSPAWRCFSPRSGSTACSPTTYRSAGARSVARGDRREPPPGRRARHAARIVEDHSRPRHRTRGCRGAERILEDAALPGESDRSPRVHRGVAGAALCRGAGRYLPARRAARINPIEALRVE